jgi:protein-disulfide isomerase
MRAIIALVSIACASLIGLAVYFAIRPAEEPPRITELHPSATVRKEKGGWILGSQNPEVTLVEYADMQCPACAAINPIIKDALQETGDFVQLQRRHYIINGHNKARIGARALEAAGRQGKFWEMQDIMFTAQEVWIEQLPGAFTDTVVGYARALQLNIDQFRTDMEASSIDQQIDQDIRNANAAGIEATPMLIINGKTITQIPRSKEQLVALLRDARGGTATPTPSPAATATPAAN